MCVAILHYKVIAYISLLGFLSITFRIIVATKIYEMCERLNQVFNMSRPSYFVFNTPMISLICSNSIDQVPVFPGTALLYRR